MCVCVSLSQLCEFLCRRIKTLFPERRKLVKMEKEEAIATKKNKEKLEQLNNEQEVCIIGPSLTYTHPHLRAHTHTHTHTHTHSLTHTHTQGIKHRLEELDQQTLAINRHIEKLTSVAPVCEDESLEADSDDLTIHCATCSMPVMLKKAMTHFERCFNKVRTHVAMYECVKSVPLNSLIDWWALNDLTTS